MTTLKPIKEWGPDEWPRVEAEWRQWQSAARAKLTATNSEEWHVLTERAWAAGFFDGEGHAGIRIPDDLELVSPKMVVHVTQAEDGGRGVATLQRFAAAAGVGKISETGGSDLSKQRIYRWEVRSEHDVERVWTVIGPFLSLPKFAQFRRVLAVPALRAIRSDYYGKHAKVRPNITSVEIDRLRAEADGTPGATTPEGGRD